MANHSYKINGERRIDQVKPTDLAHIEMPESVSLSPDGTTVVYSLKTIDIEGDKYLSHLWRVPADGSAPPSQLTRGERDADPRISPDGRWVAFLRAGEDIKPQLHLMPSDGGEPWAITTKEQHPLGVEAPVWSPDSKAVAYLARVPEKGRYGTVEKRGPEKEAPRRITVLAYRRDGVGYRNDRPLHVFTVDPFAAKPAKPEPKQLTAGEFEHSRVSWSPDGRSLAFASARHENRHTTMISDVWVMGVEDGKMLRLTETRLSCDQPVFSRDGAVVYFLGMDPGESGVDFFASQTGVYAVAADGSGAVQRVSDREKYTLDGEFHLGAQGVLYGAANRGAVDLLEFLVGEQEPRVLLSGNRQVGAVDIAGDGLAAVIADPASHGEVVFAGPAGERVLTSYGKRWAEASTVFELEEITAEAPDGYPVHGWIARPHGDGPHPVLLMIHGGPFTQYGWRLFDEAQVYAGAGYAVVYGNPRGSSGYGRAHGRHIAGDVGARSATDLLALLDHALRDPGLDANNVGVLGGSHGGFMVTWLLGHCDRFRAAISERSLNAIDSFMGTSDVGWFFTSLYGDDPEQRQAQSPLSHAHKINTPLLIIHSENDLRCPFEQGQRLFQALKGRGAEAELLAFPGEGHEMSRSGLPSHRLARFEAILEWFDRYLKPKP